MPQPDNRPSTDPRTRVRRAEQLRRERAARGQEPLKLFAPAPARVELPEDWEHIASDGERYDLDTRFELAPPRRRSKSGNVRR